MAFAVRAFRSGTVPAADEAPSDQVREGPPLTGDPEITAEIPLVGDERNAGTGGVAVGAGSAWVGIQRGVSGFVVRIDLATNEVVAEIPVRDTPWRKRIAATDESVWVASHGVLERIDPDTNTIVASVDMQGRPISAIMADSTDVWAVAITEPPEGGGEWTGSLVRVDAATNQAVAEIPLGPQVAGYEDEVMVGAGSVWVLGVRWFEKEDAEYGSDLIRIDPATNAITARIPVDGFQMVMGSDEVWVRFIADGVFDTYGERRLWTRVDVATNEPSQPFELEADGLKIVSPDALWSVDYDEQQHVRVSRLDPETLEVEKRSEPIRSLFTDAIVDPASRTVWVSAIYSVIRLDIVDEDVASASASIQIDTGGRRIGDMIAGEGVLWVTLTSEPGASARSSLLRIDPASNQLVAEIDGCAGELAVGAGAVWTWNLGEDQGAALCRIDPTTNELVATIDLPDGTLGPMVGSDEAIWISHLVVPEGGQFEDASRSILRIDPETNEIVARIPADVCTLTDADCTPTWGTAGEGAVWFEGFRLGETVRVDPSINRATTIRTGASCGLAAGEGWAWVGVRSSDGPTDVWNVAELVARIDPVTGEVAGEPIPLVGGHPDSLTGTGCPYAAGAGALWVVGSEQGTQRGLVARLDAETLELGFSIAISDDEYSWPEVAFDFEAGILWLGRGDILTRIDLP